MTKTEELKNEMLKAWNHYQNLLGQAMDANQKLREAHADWNEKLNAHLDACRDQERRENEAQDRRTNR